MKRRLFIKNLAATTLATGLVPEWKLGALAPLQAADNAAQGVSGEFFYRPAGGRVGDVIPFYDGKTIRVFYLHRADQSSPGTSWHQVSTDDFVHFVEHGEMLPRGTQSDQDLSVATGSVIKREGRYHIFYTGYNSLRKPIKPEQGVMHAVSEDLLKWEKIPSDTFYASEAHYGRDDWRDPFVFWNDEAHEYWMLVAARLRSGPLRRRGGTALCASKDLTNWEVREPFWAPGLYFTHECPDLFRIGDWWYFIFSEFSEGMQTRYRMSRKITGPWNTPEDDTFDTRGLYAAKTCSNGRSRFLLGWNPIRTAEKDDGKWQWGGNLVAHEVVQQPNGALQVQIPKSIDEAFSNMLPLHMEAVIGKCDISEDGVTIVAPQSFGAATFAPLPKRCKVTATVEFTEQTRACGLMLKLADDLDSCYYVRLEPLRSRLVFDIWPRPGDVPFMTGMERPVKLTPGEPVEIKLIVDGTIGEVYVGGRIAMSTRMYKLNLGRCGVFVREGTTHFRKLGIFSMLV